MDNYEFNIWLRKLRPYWKERGKLEREFREKEMELAKKMNKELETEIELEFFYCQHGYCAGIGATFGKDRKKFPLIHDSELEPF